MTKLASTHDDLKPHYDAIVVGSGYGGGVAASRLARAGKRVAVLERGREVATGEFPSRFPEMKNEMQVRGRKLATGPETALFDVRLGEDMHVLVGCGLGGGSLVNAGVALRPDARVFADEVWPDEIRQDGLLDEGFARAEHWLAPMSDPRASELTKYKALETSGSAFGDTTIAPRVAVSFTERTNEAGIHQPACTRCGDCCGGCNVGAKNTIALTYLPDAKQHGAELFTHIKVRHVAKDSDGLWRVAFALLNETGHGVAREGELSADIVVLAAGTLGSTEILLRSRERGLPLSDRLGQRFSANGDIIAFGWGAKPVINAVGVGHPPKIEGREIGAAVSGQIEIRNAEQLSHELTVQEGVLPSALAPALPLLFLPNGRLLGALQSIVKGVYNGPFAHLQTFFAVSHDSASGSFQLLDDKLTLSWPGAKDEPAYRRLDDKLTDLVTQSGGSYVKNPLAGTVMGHQPATAHPLGGCGMGRDIGDGVVNHKGQVFDGGNGKGPADVHAGLYVIDGAIIPRSLGCNPLFTITALAERAIMHMATDLALRPA
ncbi:MAG: GMC family oxidoreductase [Hyphomicrobiaceae bacterium]|nr:GMC family oxidoreductase [Hyphomicrobiaceae bacterium]